MEERIFTVIEDGVKKNDDVVVVINDWYDNCDRCDYVLPRDTSRAMQCTIVKDPVKDTNKCVEVNYSLWL